ncbi:MAG: threonine/serine dehydratase [Acidiferrobacterales bacterium]
MSKPDSAADSQHIKRAESSASLTAPAFSDVVDAAARIRGEAVVTPLLESPALSALTGGRVLIKAEMLQRTGAFKFRGAFNRLSRLDPVAQSQGVVAYSSGNHAQGIAAAAQILGIPALIVMPDDAPAIKLANTRSYGAEVRLYDRYREDREQLAKHIAAERGATLDRTYEDPYIIAGQGTVGLEIADQAAARDAKLDAVLVPCGGGGLIAGCAIALAARSPDTAVYAVEPEGFDDTARSLAAGRRLHIRDDVRSMCDALLVPIPGELTFAINSRHLAGGLVVSDAEAARAMALAFHHLKLVVEPGGVVALAAALSGKYDCQGKTVAVVCSGGNVDADTFRQVLQTAGLDIEG